MKLDEVKAIIPPEVLKLELMLRKARKHVIPFLQAIDPEYIPSWHHVYLANNLMEFFIGDLDRLMISIPPQHGKTRLVAGMVAFIFGHLPNKKILSASYASSLADDISRDIQKILESDMYQLIFPDTKIAGMAGVTARAKKTDKHWDVVYKDKTVGFYKCAGVDGSMTGKSGDILIIDDPHKNGDECMSETARKRVHSFYTTTAKSRLKKNGKILIIQTRWHEDDLSGHILEKAKTSKHAKPWRKIYFEAIRSNEPCPYDPRKEGEVLWEAHHDFQSLMEKKEETPPLWWEAIYQQRPSKITGSIFKDEYWQYYDELPKSFSRVVQFWDCAQKPGISNDYSVCATYGETERGYFLIDLWRDKVEAPELERALESQFLKFKPSAVVIEDKSAGSSLIQYGKRSKLKIPIQAFLPEGDKTLRAINATPTIKAGNWFLPRIAAFLNDFLTEHRSFPSVAHDDQVDTTSMARQWFVENQPKVLRISMLG